MGSYHLWDYDWTPLSQNPCWNHTTILSLRDILRISCKNTLVDRLKESKLYGIEWNGSIVAIVCRRLNVKEGLYEYELACSSESLRFSLSFWLNWVGNCFGIFSAFFGIFGSEEICRRIGLIIEDPRGVSKDLCLHWAFGIRHSAFGFRLFGRGLGGECGGPQRV